MSSPHLKKRKLHQGITENTLAHQGGNDVVNLPDITHLAGAYL
jgi:hypothetical protein